jgi:hypothetical protein
MLSVSCHIPLARKRGDKGSSFYSGPGMERRLIRITGFLFIAAVLTAGPSSAQLATGEWFSAEVEFDLPKKFTVETSLEARALNIGGIQFYKYFAQSGLNYKISKRFDVGVKYRYDMRLEENMHFYPRNRWMFDFKFDYPVYRFRFDYRARLQRFTKNYINDVSDLGPIVHLRNRLRVSYDIKKNPIRPSCYIEIFNPLSAYKPGAIDQTRIGAEMRFPVANKQTVTGGIMYVRDQFETGASGLIFVLDYKISLF